MRCDCARGAVLLDYRTVLHPLSLLYCTQRLCGALWLSTYFYTSVVRWKPFAELETRLPRNKLPPALHHTAVDYGPTTVNGVWWPRFASIRPMKLHEHRRRKYHHPHPPQTNGLSGGGNPNGKKNEMNESLGDLSNRGDKPQNRQQTELAAAQGGAFSQHGLTKQRNLTTGSLCS